MVFFFFMSQDIVLAISRFFSSRIYKVARFFAHSERVVRWWHSVVKRMLICGDFIVDFK